VFTFLLWSQFYVFLIVLSARREFTFLLRSQFYVFLIVLSYRREFIFLLFAGNFFFNGAHDTASLNCGRQKKSNKRKGDPFVYRSADKGKALRCYVGECYCALRWFYPCAGWLFGFGGFAASSGGRDKMALIMGWAVDSCWLVLALQMPGWGVLVANEDEFMFMQIWRFATGTT
jgi:hypothetical protein